ncbi:MAG: UDP binding domain-containing protein, partial [Acinetobacter sp.]
FTYEAEKLGYHSQIILAGRKVNDGMGGFIGEAIMKQLILSGKAPKRSKVVILGLTFKENCPDTRNSKVEDIIKKLNEYGIEPVVVDPMAKPEDAKHEYGVELTALDDVRDADCVVIAVAHDEFKTMTIERLDGLFATMPVSEKVIIDVKSILDKVAVEKAGYRYWRL